MEIVQFETIKITIEKAKLAELLSNRTGYNIVADDIVEISPNDYSFVEVSLAPVVVDAVSKQKHVHVLKKDMLSLKQVSEVTVDDFESASIVNGAILISCKKKQIEG